MVRLATALIFCSAVIGCAGPQGGYDDLNTACFEEASVDILDDDLWLRFIDQYWVSLRENELKTFGGGGMQTNDFRLTNINNTDEMDTYVTHNNTHIVTETESGKLVAVINGFFEIERGWIPRPMQSCWDLEDWPETMINRDLPHHLQGNRF